MDGMIDRKKMRRPQLTDPVNIERFSALCLDCGAGPGPVISPERSRWKIAMHLELELAHFNFDNGVRFVDVANNRWNRQRIDVARQSDTATNLRRGRHGLADGGQAFCKGESRSWIETSGEKPW